MSLGGTPFDELFAALTTRMGIPNLAESSPSQRDRVEWERSGPLGSEPIGYTRPGAKYIKRRSHPWTATVYAGSDFEVCRLIDQLEGHLDELLGPEKGCEVEGHDGYKFAAGKIEPRGGDGKAAGYACDAAITLYRPVVSQIRPTAPITSVSVTVTATAAASASADEAPLAWQS